MNTVHSDVRTTTTEEAIYMKDGDVPKIEINSGLD
jgi:hypothetical protein